MKDEIKEQQTTTNIDEILKKQKSIYPTCIESIKYDQKVDNLYKIENWSEMFYGSKTELVKERFLKIISISEYSKFFEGLDYEYGTNGKPQDIQKAFEIYKQQADNSTDTLSMYKMYHIYRNEFKKFNFSERNKVLERFYLFKCFTYLSNQELERYSFLLNRFQIILELKMYIFYEDKDLQKFDNLINHLCEYYDYYKIKKDELLLIDAVISFEYKNNNNDRALASEKLKKLLDKKLEAKYKLQIFDLKYNDKSEKLFEELEHENYYRSFCDYAVYLYMEKKDYKKSLELLKKAISKGIIRANYLYYDIFLNNCFDFSKIEINQKFKDDLLFLFNRLIDDIATDGIYSYFEFFFLRKLCIKHWNLKSFIESNIDSFTKDFMKMLLDNTCDSLSEEEIKNKKDLMNMRYIRIDFFLEFHLSCGVLFYYGIENLLDIDLKKSLMKLQISFDNNDIKPYKRFCYSYISRIKQKLYEIDDKLISNLENENSKKILFDLYYSSLEKQRIKYLSSSFFYYLSKLYKKKWGNPGDEIMEKICLKKASEVKGNIPGRGTILTYYRKYKSSIIINKNWEKFMFEITINKDSEGYGDDNSICPICIDNKRNIILLPCKHLLCELCTKKIMETDICPICRRIILYNFNYENKINENNTKNEEEKEIK